ncbi:YdcF family protein, partial [Roseococcus sp. DSY-14]|uniref:YdcF family protein n=1 Tax=Roseococcus sp. DSY-14 TaxID=3369650 RepID=UPI00387A8EBA
AAGRLRAGLEAAILPAPPGAARPGAIVILGAEAREGPAGHEPGPLTLERLRAGAALARATGLPVLVTGGVVSRNGPPVAQLMAESLQADFGVAARWVEGEAADTRGNALRSAALLRADGVEAARLVTHGWHMRRAQEAFARAGLPVQPAPARLGLPAAFAWPDLVPRPDNWGTSWFMLREWAGLWAYRWRDGGA